MAYVMKVDGLREYTETYEEAEKYAFEQIRPLIGAEWLEMISVPNNDQAVMLVDEEGLLNKKPINLTASVLAERKIVGDVFVCNRKQID